LVVKERRLVALRRCASQIGQQFGHFLGDQAVLTWARARAGSKLLLNDPTEFERDIFYGVGKSCPTFVIVSTATCYQGNCRLTSSFVSY